MWNCVVVVIVVAYMQEIAMQKAATNSHTVCIVVSYLCIGPLAVVIFVGAQFDPCCNTQIKTTTTTKTTSCQITCKRLRELLASLQIWKLDPGFGIQSEQKSKDKNNNNLFNLFNHYYLSLSKCYCL